MWKTVRIDMASRTSSEEPYKEEYAGLGGRGLVARVLLDEIDPACDPLGPGNTIVLATTAFAGMGFGCVNRLSVGCKSPLTGGIKEANVGGTVATYLAHHGIRMIIIEGQPAEDGLWVVRIDGMGEVTVEDALPYRGVNNYDAVAALRRQYGEKIAVASIGSAGERLYSNSTVQVTEFGTGYPNRAAARGGVGAVLGSKRVKALVVEPAERRFAPTYADEERFSAVRSALNDIIEQGAAEHELRSVGTAEAVRIHHTQAILPVNNFSGKDMANIEDIYPEKFMEIVKKRGKNGHACQAGCRVRCSNELFDDDGVYVTGGLEYETIALLGANTAIADLDAIARMDRMCDDLGVDTIETGASIAVCMDGGKIPWGDAGAAMGLIEEMADGTEFGLLMGRGTEAVGIHLGVRRIPVAHHMAFPGYDIRGAAPTGVAFAGGAQGADHTTCPSHGALEQMTDEEICGLSYTIQTIFAMYDNLTCIFAGIFLEQHLDKVADLYSAAYGVESSPDVLLDLGARTLAWEKQFNRAAGWRDEDDVIPEFFYTDVSELSGAVFRVPQEAMSQTVKI